MVAIVATFVLIVNHKAAGIIGVAISLALIVLWFVVPNRFLDWRVQRDLESQVANVTHGEICSAAAIYRGHGGDIYLNQVGVQFAPRNIGPDAYPIALSWSEVKQFDLGPIPGKIGVGRLTLEMMGGGREVFTVVSYRQMAAI